MNVPSDDCTWHVEKARGPAALGASVTRAPGVSDRLATSRDVGLREHRSWARYGSGRCAGEARCAAGEQGHLSLSDRAGCRAGAEVGCLPAMARSPWRRLPPGEGRHIASTPNAESAASMGAAGWRRGSSCAGLGGRAWMAARGAVPGASISHMSTTQERYDAYLRAGAGAGPSAAWWS